MDTLITWWRGPQTLGSAVGRLLLPRVLVFASIATMLVVGHAMTVSPTSAELDALPAPSPLWTLAQRADDPDCVPLSRWPAGRAAADVVVSRAADNRVFRIAFDSAWAANHNRSEDDDVWVLAVCAEPAAKTGAR